MMKRITETLQIRFLIHVLILGGLNRGISLCVHLNMDTSYILQFQFRQLCVNTIIYILLRAIKKEYHLNDPNFHLVREYEIKCNILCNGEMMKNIP